MSYQELCAGSATVVCVVVVRDRKGTVLSVGMVRIGDMESGINKVPQRA